MAMFSYFPGNYVWNLAVDIAIESGAQIGEIEEMCAPLREAARQGSDVGTNAFMAAWVAMADRLVELADEDVALGRGFSAADKLDRASLYYQTAERMQPPGHPDRLEVFPQGQDAFRRATEAGRLNRERVDIAYEGGVIPGWFTRATWGEGPRPTMAIASKVTLEGVLDRIRVPFLVTHGVNDRQIPVDYAHRTFDQLVNSPKRELKLFDERTGGVEHVSLDTLSFGRTYIADWVAETFGERTQ